jgi:hypothetical protein
MSEPGTVTRVAVDAGTLVSKIAVAVGSSGSPGQEPPPPTEEHPGATGTDGQRAALAAALAAAARVSRASGPGRGTGLQLSLAVPDAWLDGSVEGTQRQEELRHLAEDEFGLTRLSWTGQLAAVAALAASRRGFAAPGRYLLCDIGGCGVRVAACEVTGRTVRPLAVHDAPGGGWRDFDAAVRTTLLAESDPGLATWYRSAIEQSKRATTVFRHARSDPALLDAQAYSLVGAASRYNLTAGQAAGCFAPTMDRIRTGLAAVSDGAEPAAAVLTGALAWFPQARQAVAEAARSEPDVLGPDASVLGALLFADGQAQLAPHGLPPVTLPAHRIRDGQLEETSLPLPWTDSFASTAGEPLVLDDPELTLDIGRRRVTLLVPGLTRGPYRVGVRPSWSGRGVLVLRAEHDVTRTAGPAQTDPRRDVHVLLLVTEEMPR